MTRTLVLKSPGFAGLGDLLLALDRALLLAGSTGRALVIDWRDTPYSRGQENLFDELFSLFGVEVRPVSTLHQACGSVDPPAWDGCLDQPMRIVYAGQCNTDWNRSWAKTTLDAGAGAFTSEASWVVVWDHCQPQLADWVPGSAGQQDRNPLAEHLRATEAIQIAIDEFRNQHFKATMVGVHGRAATEAVRAGKSATLSQLGECLDPLLSEHPTAGLFLTSDNQLLITALHRRYPSAVIRPKWLPEPGAPLHLAPPGDLPRLQIAIDSVVDLWLLASCTWIIHPAGSSFSIAACRLSRLSPGKIRAIPPPCQAPPSISGRFRALLSRWRRSMGTWLRQLLAVP